jgi:hypothetical protein
VDSDTNPPLTGWLSINVTATGNEMPQGLAGVAGVSLLFSS